MDKKPRKTSPRLSAPPPGILAFADGGTVRPETADELMARMTTKYGAPSAGKVQAEAAQPVPQPQQKAQPAPQQPQGIIGILKGRKEAIDKAAGFANGGKISGPGTPTSDSIPATVLETGEGIQVSNGERIVSVEQGKFLEAVAKNAGYESLDKMLEDGTGKPVGPTIKGGKRAAETGMMVGDVATDPDTDGRRQYSPTYSASFTNRGDIPASGITVAPGHDDSVKAAIAAPPVLGNLPVSRSEPVGTLTGPASGIDIAQFGPRREPVGSGLAGIDLSLTSSQAQQLAKPGRDTSGIITAESAQAVAGADMQRSGGISGTFDGKGVNDIMARENQARGEMIDASIRANGGNGIGILGGDGPTEAERINTERTNRWAIDDLRDSMKRAGTRTERAALGQALATTIAGQNQQAVESIRQDGIVRGQDLSYGARMAQQGLTARAQELGLQKAQDRNDILARGQDIRADTAAARINSNETIAKDRAQRIGQPTLAQQRGNAEIDAARERIAGMTPEDLRQKTTSALASGRDNPLYDGTLAKAVSQANRRKVGADDDFDSRQTQGSRASTQQPKFSADDVNAALSAGADRGKMAERIKLLGGNPADYGL